MASAANDRTRNLIVLATLAICALFCAQGATALLADKALRSEEGAAPVRSGKTAASARMHRRHDPTIILRRNIFDSALGDLSVYGLEDSELPMTDVPSGEVETQCSGTMRVIGTVVIPGDLERSLAAIVGSDSKASLHYGGTEVEGSRIRAIHSDAVVLQGKQGLCRLAMFQVDAPAKRPVFRPSKKPVEAAEKKNKRKATIADRNAGLNDAEMAEGIERINDQNFNLSRSMLNKVLDNAGKIIGIAAVAPKIENGASVGMEIRGIRPDTLLTKIGIQNLDVLESVNGQSLSNPDAALGAYTTLRTADKFTLSVRRDGKSMMINYNLQ